MQNRKKIIHSIALKLIDAYPDHSLYKFDLETLVEKSTEIALMTDTEIIYFYLALMELSKRLDFDKMTTRDVS